MICLKTKRINSKSMYRKYLMLQKLYFTADIKLSGRQILVKLRIHNFLSYVLLTVLLIVVLIWSLVYFEIHHGIHFENVSYARTGVTSISCYNNYRGLIICCADKPYVSVRILNSSRKPFGVYECYKFQDIDWQE